MPVSTKQLAILVLAGAILAAVTSVAALVSTVVSRRQAGAAPPPGVPRPATDVPGSPDADGMARMDLAPVSDHTHRVARVVSLLYLAGVAVVVAVTGAWPEAQAAVFAALALGTLLVVLFLDMLPRASLGLARRPVEAVGAIVFVGLLMALTGGVASPFVVGLYLVVVGAALVLEGSAPALVAATAVSIHVVVALLASPETALRADGLAVLLASAVTLVLLSTIATTAGRLQRRARDEALRLSRFDPLTGLFNRSHLVSTVEQEIGRASRMARPFSLLMLDLDDLKPVNDTYGHPVGDQLLQSVAEVVRTSIRLSDTAARYGGDEFMVLLPETNAAGASIVAEKLRRDIAAIAVRVSERSVRTSVSIGLVAYPDDGATVDQLVSAVDVAMYEAKRQGKNQIVGYATRTERVVTAMEPGQGLPGPLTPASPAASGPAPGGVPGSAPDARTPAALGRADAAKGASSARSGPAPVAVTVAGDAPWLTRTGLPASAGVTGEGRPWVALPIERDDDAPGERADG
jgi:diguanylate cyclase (GGDEF)-like protein